MAGMERRLPAALAERSGCVRRSSPGVRVSGKGE
jgi:hypothetical protein